MSMVLEGGPTWSAPITLSAAEIWQVRRGRAYVSTTPAPADDDGLELTQGSAVRFEAGVSVRYRAGTRGAMISRVEVAP